MNSEGGRHGGIKNKNKLIQRRRVILILNKTDFVCFSKSLLEKRTYPSGVGFIRLIVRVRQQEAKPNRYRKV